MTSSNVLTRNTKQQATKLPGHTNVELMPEKNRSASMTEHRHRLGKYGQYIRSPNGTRFEILEGSAIPKQWRKKKPTSVKQNPMALDSGELFNTLLPMHVLNTV